MTAFEQRFLTGFRAGTSEEPGIIMENDGTIQVVRLGGQRVNLAPVAGYTTLLLTLQLLIGSTASFPVSGGADPTGSFQGIATGPPLLCGAGTGFQVVRANTFSVQGIPASSHDFALVAQVYAGDLTFDNAIRVEVDAQFSPSAANDSFEVDWREAVPTVLAGSDLSWVPSISSPVGEINTVAGGVFVSAINFFGGWL